MTDEPTAAERFTANISGGGADAPPTSPSAAGPSGPHIPTRAEQDAAAREELSRLALNPEFTKALYDNQHPGHEASVKAKQEIYARIYGNEERPATGADYTIEQGQDGGYQLVDQRPTPEEQADMRVAAAASAIERQQFSEHVSRPLAAWADHIGMETHEVAELASSIRSHRPLPDADAAREALGPEADGLIQRARAVVQHYGIPPAVLNLVIDPPTNEKHGNHEGVALGDHPQFIRALARIGQRLDFKQRWGG